MNKTSFLGSVVLPSIRHLGILLAVLTLLFFLQRLTGDPVAVLVGHGATPEAIAAVRSDMGLDRSVFTQYTVFLSKTAVLDFGESTRTQQPALEMVLARFPATLLLSLSAVGLAVGLGIPLGVYAAIYHRRLDGRIINLLCGVLQSTPNFWLGLILLLVFSVKLNWVGSVANLEDNVFRRLALPSITLSAFYMARLVRLVRSGVLDEMSQPYILTAHAKGLSSRVVFYRHIFRNTLIPVITFITLDLSLLINGSVIVENLFSYSGIGDQMINAIFNRDYPLVQATVFVIAIFIISINVMARYLHKIVDPRISA